MEGIVPQGRLSDKDVENSEEDQRDNDDADLLSKDERTEFCKEEWEELFGQS